MRTTEGNLRSVIRDVIKDQENTWVVTFTLN